MPDDVWTRMASAIAAEAASRAPAGATVVPITRKAGRSRPMAWVGGLVAASVAVVAVGAGIGVVRTGSSGSVVAGDAPAASQDALAGDPSAEEAPLAEQVPDATTEDAVPTPASVDAGAAEELATSTPEAALPDEVAPMSVAPVAKMVMASNTDYTRAQLPDQVVSLVRSAGFGTEREARTKVVPTPTLPSEDGFTASWAALRACLIWLTQQDDPHALVVDRGTYGGADAGVVVAPAVAPDDDPATPAPSLTLTTASGAFDVWVVNPECESVETRLDDFALYEWQP